MFSGIAESIKISRWPAYLEATDRTVDFIFTRRSVTAACYNTYKSGTGKILGYLDDYAFLEAGALGPFEATVNREQLRPRRGTR